MEYQAAGVLFHYLDNFITIAPPDSEECARNFQKFSEMGGEEETVGPVTCSTFWRIEVDTEQLEPHLPDEKLQSVE